MSRINSFIEQLEWFQNAPLLLRDGTVDTMMEDFLTFEEQLCEELEISEKDREYISMDPAAWRAYQEGGQTWIDFKNHNDWIEV